VVHLSPSGRRNEYNPRLSSEHLALHKLVDNQRWCLDIGVTEFPYMLGLKKPYSQHRPRRCIVDIDIDVTIKVSLDSIGDILVAGRR
jgi:hypothetical protein